MLRPIISRFISAFDEKPDLDFWNCVCHVHPGGSGISFISGWLTTFCVWTNEGKWFGPKIPSPGQNNAPTTYGPTPSRSGLRDPITPLFIDDVQYPIIESSDVPVGFCEVDIKLDDNGKFLNCLMVAGHIASVIEGVNSDSLRPFPVWFIFVKE